MQLSLETVSDAEPTRALRQRLVGSDLRADRSSKAARRKRRSPRRCDPTCSSSPLPHPVRSRASLGPKRTTPTMKAPVDAIRTAAAEISFASRATGWLSGRQRSTVFSKTVFSASVVRTRAIVSTRISHSITEIQNSQPNAIAQILAAI